tara:strand:- start:1912 stop:4917 length:3006 start_codon:yes stop_codon:yes gene_type:complete
MSVSSFKFVSPGVFINEIDNSFIPKSADTIGPVIIGRAARGLAMQPTVVESYSEFVDVFGGTVPGNGGGDVYRDGNFQSPMYGTYAAKAFLASNVAPVTYVRLLGTQNTNATSDGFAGWRTLKDPATTQISQNGGAYGMFVFASGSNSAMGNGKLAAIWYVDTSASVFLSGTLRGGGSGRSTAAAARSQNEAGVGMVIGSDSTGLYTVLITGSNGTKETIRFNFDDSSENFIRKKFNTNPQLGNAGATDFYPAHSKKLYWLGETFEQELREGVTDSLTGGGADLSAAETQAVILPLGSGSGDNQPYKMNGINYNEAVAGWFIGQDTGAPTDYQPTSIQKLFRLKGRGHGAWLNRNVKVSIANIRASTTTVSDYGTFSVILRYLKDTDNNIQVMERFDNLTLDPASPDFIARRIGDMYTAWQEPDRELRVYGEYPNKSKFVYVDMNTDVEAGATDPALLPFGYYGPPRFSTISNWVGLTGSWARFGDFAQPAVKNAYVYIGTEGAVGTRANDLSGALGGSQTNYLSGGVRLTSRSSGTLALLTGTLVFPRDRLRLSASDGGFSQQTDAYFGFSSTRSQTSTRPDASLADAHRLWLTNLNTDPVGSNISGVDSYSYIFTMDDIQYFSSDGGYAYISGSRKLGVSYTSVGGNSYRTLLDTDINKFTAPFWGGFDALDIKKPDPFYNEGIKATTTSQENSYPYNTLKRAIDTVSDPEFINMNLMITPGLTNKSLTTHMINVCEERADSLAIIDLPDVYIPPHEKYYASKASRIGTTPTTAANSLRDRRIDSSYGCTFYPWVQTRDEATGQLVWIPPSVAMLGVLGTSQASTDVWFAPAGFNRGGLTDGAAGIPVVNITERLTSKNRDTLYENRINPIASFPSSGIVVFGQKTLQERQSALDRINVRRLVIYLKKQISILSTQVLFEQNVEATWLRFKGLIEPFLSNVQIQFGITDFRLILDSSTTTPDLIDQNILYAKIMVKPARAIEYIAIDFVISSTGASFDD